MSTRRDEILRAVREASERDPEQTTVSSLTRSQFNDHIPPMLDAFARRLQARSGGVTAVAAELQRNQQEIKHGLQRWQQGYRLRELLHEWGHLQASIFDEMNAFAAQHPEFEREAFAEAVRQLIQFIAEAIGTSTGQYAKLQQDEASGHLRDLQRAIAEMKDLERRRTALIHQAVHDLRGNVQSVSSAAEVLKEAGIPERERKVFVQLLLDGTEAVNSMMCDLMDLARLEAGQEQRELAAFDVAGLIAEFCKVTQPVAQARDLFLRLEGPAPLTVEGDANKVRRILQNLVLNALKYTQRGGVTVRWGEQGETSWWLMIKDTGPGLMAGPGTPLVGDLKDATASARESDETAAKGESSHVLPSSESARVSSPANQQAGEGIGLSIVKRLCEMLDASLELASSATEGTTFRIVFPRRYSPTV